MNKRDNASETLRSLKAQLEFIEKQGYRQPGRTPWRPPAVFLDSPTCLNFGTPYKAHPCDECVLMRFVPAARQKENTPCHHIPLTEAGDTVKSAEAWADQDEIEELVKAWLRKTIAQLEDTLADFTADKSAKTGQRNRP